MSWTSTYESINYGYVKLRARCVEQNNAKLRAAGSLWTFDILKSSVSGDWYGNWECDGVAQNVFGHRGKFCVGTKTEFDTLEEACAYLGVPLYPRDGARALMCSAGLSTDEINAALGIR